MNELLNIGFQPCGHWLLEGDRIRSDLARFSTLKNVLYAFVSDGTLMYVGKTSQPLASRMGGYRNPAPTQSTNVRNNARIRSLLQAGSAVEILALPDNSLHHYGIFHLNLAAGLEDDIIRKLQPPWNGDRGISAAEIAQAKLGDSEEAQVEQQVELPVQHTFLLNLGITYHRTGFFNVGVADQQWIGADGEMVEFHLPALDEPILGTINRRANLNGTPRLMGGTALRDWFQTWGKAGDRLEVTVLSPNALRLALKA